MSGKTRLSIASLGVVAAIGILFAVLPAFGSSHENAIRLHMSPDLAGIDPPQFFSYPGESDQVVQSLTKPAKKSCELDTNTSIPQTLISLSAINGNLDVLPVGNVDYSLGVKSGGSNSNGTPCSQVQIGESLTLEPGSLFNSASALNGRSFDAVRLDIEMTNDAVVRVTMLGDPEEEVFYLETGTSIISGSPSIGSDPSWTPSTSGGGRPATEYGVSGDAYSCIVANSSGPNSSSSDNCLWTIDPIYDFDGIKLEVVQPSNGSVSLEGSHDWGGGSEYDTLFYIANAAPVANDDSYPVLEGGTLVADGSTILGVGSNDTDADDEGGIPSGEVSLVVGPSYDSSFSLNPDGTFTYVHDGSETPPVDSFTYRVSDSDGAVSNVATVTITITPVDDPPTVGGSFTISEDATVPEDGQVDIRILDVADDVDSSSLTVTCELPTFLDETGTEVPIGTYDDNGDGSITFTPAANYNTGTESVSFTCSADDTPPNQTLPGRPISGIVSLTVTAAIDDDVAYVDTPLPGFVDINVLSNDGGDLVLSDASGTVPRVGDLYLTTGNGGTVHVIDLDGTAPGEVLGFQYTAPTVDGARALIGSDSFEYYVSDGTPGFLQGPATVTVYELFNCGETLSTAGNGIEASYTRLDVPGCEGKLYTIRTTETGPGLPTVVFEPAQPVACEVDCPTVPFSFSFTDRWRDVDPDVPQYFGTLEVDPDGLGEGLPFDRAPECVSYTADWRVVVDEFEVERPFAEITAAELPVGATWCWAVTFTETQIGSDGVAETRTHWFGYGENDPAKRAS